MARLPQGLHQRNGWGGLWASSSDYYLARRTGPVLFTVHYQYMDSSLATSLCEQITKTRNSTICLSFKGEEMRWSSKKTWNINGAWHRRQMHVTQSIIFAWNVIRKKKKRRRKKRTNTRMYAHSHRKWENESTHTIAKRIFYFIMTYKYKPINDLLVTTYRWHPMFLFKQTISSTS